MVVTFLSAHSETGVVPEHPEHGQVCGRVDRRLLAVDGKGIRGHGRLRSVGREGVEVDVEVDGEVPRPRACGPRVGTGNSPDSGGHRQLADAAGFLAAGRHDEHLHVARLSFCRAK